MIRQLVCSIVVLFFVAAARAETNYTKIVFRDGSTVTCACRARISSPLNMYINSLDYQHVPYTPELRPDKSIVIDPGQVFVWFENPATNGSYYYADANDIHELQLGNEVLTNRELGEHQENFRPAQGALKPATEEDFGDYGAILSRHQVDASAFPDQEIVIRWLRQRKLSMQPVMPKLSSTCRLFDAQSPEESRKKIEGCTKWDVLSYVAYKRWEANVKREEELRREAATERPANPSSNAPAWAGSASAPAESQSITTRDMISTPNGPILVPHTITVSKKQQQ